MYGMLSHAGGSAFSVPPESVLLDPGTEFQGYFADATGYRGIAMMVTDARAPWQNGRTERAGN